MKDLERLARGFKLQPTQRRYLEAVRWLMTPEPRAEGRSVLQAYIVIEMAIKSPGNRIFVPQDHAGTTKITRIRLEDVIQQMFRTEPLKSLFAGRYVLNSDGLTVYPVICAYCSHAEDEHVDGKCMFHATRFKGGGVGRIQLPNGTWDPFVLATPDFLMPEERAKIPPQK